MYPRARINRVVEIAIEAAKAHKSGDETYLATEYAHGNGVADRLNLTEGGMCNRFVRQVFEVALGLDEQTWPYRAGRAIWTIDSLQAAGLGIKERNAADLKPGDIVGIHTGTFGHIAIYIGGGLIAENTSSSTRGTPRRAGTKLTPYEALSGRVTHVFRLAETGIIVVRQSVTAGAVEVTRRAQLINGEAWGPVREMAAALGYAVDASELQTTSRITLAAR
jgi:hypothetical protein